MVSKNLSTWFIIHFIADFLFAIAPVWILTLFGWETVDAFTARLVGAALVGIGGASLIERNASTETFRAMLNLKLLWASTAIVGMVATLLTGNYPLSGWGFVLIFVAFFFIWLYYRNQLKEN